MADTKKFLDAEGVKHLWSKVNMQDYPNNETLMAVINAIDETKADKNDIITYLIPYLEDVVLGDEGDLWAWDVGKMPEPWSSTSIYLMSVNNESLQVVTYDATADHRYSIKYTHQNGDIVYYGSNASEGSSGNLIFKDYEYYDEAPTVSLYRVNLLPDYYLSNNIARVSDITTPVQSDWNETDETSLAYIKNKPDENDALELLNEMGMIEATAAADGSIYIEDTGVIYTL